MEPDANSDLDAKLREFRKWCENETDEELAHLRRELGSSRDWDPSDRP
jgi:hypothetical protein